ncbi:unnamed protein product, partial [Durusdinium trenchii]
MFKLVMSCGQCCGAGCRYHGRHGSRSCAGCQAAADVAIAHGRIPRCAQCGQRDPSGRVDERQTRQFYCGSCWAQYENDRLTEYFDSEAELRAKCQRLAADLRTTPTTDLMLSTSIHHCGEKEVGMTSTSG